MEIDVGAKRWDSGPYRGPSSPMYSGAQSSALDGYAVCPGTIDTPMVSSMLDKGMLAMDDLLRDLPMKRLGKGEEIADAVLWLCSPGSTFVTGQALAVDGGFTVQ